MLGVGSSMSQVAAPSRSSTAATSNNHKLELRIPRDGCSSRAPDKRSLEYLILHGFELIYMMYSTYEVKNVKIQAANIRGADQSYQSRQIR